MVKERNMWMQALLFFITVGLYGYYWFYVTTKEMIGYKKLDGSPGLLTVLLLVPIANLYAQWKHSSAVEALTEGRYNRVLVFVLWLFFSPAVWFITQWELNKVARQPAAA